MPSAIAEPEQARPHKRQRIAPQQAKRPLRTTSRVFAAYRTVGLVSPTPVPFATQPLGKTSFHITTSVGRCLQTYDLRKGLNLVFLTRPQTTGAITATTTWAEKTVAAWSTAPDAGTRGVWIYKRGKKLAELASSPHATEDVVQLRIFGSWIIGCCATVIEVWNAVTLEHHTTLQPPYSDSEAPILTGGIATVPTYTNKILAGREDGSLEIWNVSSGKLLYSISPPSSDVGPISCIEPTPALSLVAIAYSNGLLIVHNIQTDQEVLRLNAGSAGQLPITTISFRTDSLGAGQDGQHPGVMATASFNSGDVTLWDLNDGGSRMAVIRSAHRAPSFEDGKIDGGVSRVEFLSSQAILVTSGADNSLRTWIFDQTPFSPLPRPLHSRSGHSGGVTTLSFVPTDSDGADSSGKWLMSASQDRSLWGWSLRRDGQSTELSQGAVQKKAKKMGMLANRSEHATGSSDDLKAPRITCLACSMNRDGGMGAMAGTKTLWASAKQLKGSSTATDQNLTGWESIVTGHDGDYRARTWFWGRKRAGRWILETGDKSKVTSVAVSPCGTFAIVGSELGGVDMYNLQSGSHRQRYPAKLTQAQAKKLEARLQEQGHSGNDAQGQWEKGRGKHTRAVTGIEADNLNRFLISCGLDGRVKFWNFSNGQLLHELDWHAHCVVLGMKLHRPSGLLALSCSDLAVRVVDIDTRRVIRELSLPNGAKTINDWCFSADGRWVITASADSIIRVWDLATGSMIDALRLSTPAKAIAFSPTGEYLATAPEGEVGVDIWTNRTLFAHAPTKPIAEEDIALVASPVTSGEGGQSIVASAVDQDSPSDTIESDNMDGPLPALEQLSREVETLSLTPRSRWQTLLHLDLIRQRNKPVEPPKAAEKAPFFLPSLQQSQDAFPRSTAGLIPGTSDQETVGHAAEQSRIMKIDATGIGNRFTDLLAQGQSKGSYTTAIEYLKGLSPSAADIEIRSIDSNEPYTEFLSFTDALTEQLKAKRDYELVQAWMSVFLKCHGEAIAEIGQDEDQGSELLEKLRDWRQEQKKEAERLGQLTAYCTGVVGFLRSAR